MKSEISLTDWGIRKILQHRKIYPKQKSLLAFTHVNYKRKLEHRLFFSTSNKTKQNSKSSWKNQNLQQAFFWAHQFSCFCQRSTTCTQLLHFTLFCENYFQKTCQETSDKYTSTWLNEKKTQQLIYLILYNSCNCLLASPYLASFSWTK